MSKAVELSSLLMDVEAQLRQLGLWQTEAPSAEALASTEPFCIDTLSFPQWLQFIFLARLYSMISLQQALPTSCSIAPMADEYFKSSEHNVTALLAILEQIDQLLSS
ncbi:YqcC family protein [Oceanicoccus sagamiensis]|uniref:Pseudouridine synthase n=1 Tax=Oceanicoccus sagamiensis TaxID=716816 RepID=A0A1X9NBK0_9GAMM|nr:YqcC family protein [Oceanicoccus sagamiensis]ARN74541.1 pseudouridine synthase [Oceanicoccus sagamiensis]